MKKWLMWGAVAVAAWYLLFRTDKGRALLAGAGVSTASVPASGSSF